MKSRYKGYEHEIELGRYAAKMLRLTPEIIESLEAKFGYFRVMAVFASIGRKMKKMKKMKKKKVL